MFWAGGSGLHMISGIEHMNTFILCTGKTAEHPYRLKAEAIPVYDLDELCCYMKEHLFLMNRDFMNQGLTDWLETELKMPELAGEIRALMGKQPEPYEAVMRIFEASGSYDAAELEQMSRLMESLSNKTDIEKKKVRADYLAGMHKYRDALLIYREILKEKYFGQMTEDLRASICHNIGVIYARFYQFSEAADMFLSAFQLSDSVESRRAWLCARLMQQRLDPGTEDSESAIDVSEEELEDVSRFLEERLSRQELLEEGQGVSILDPGISMGPESGTQELLTGWLKEYISAL